MEAFASLVEKYGLSIVVIFALGWFCLQLQKKADSREKIADERHDKLALRLSKVEDYVRGEFTVLVKDSNRIHQESINVIKACEKVRNRS